jgi:ribulose-5-phosphate 4-epimerase/fuculose-1-phosphate aldolase
MNNEHAAVRATPAGSMDREWALRVDLAAAYRLVALFGWDDLIFTHISVRLPGPEHRFLINPYGMLFEEITASSLVKVDLSGQIIDATHYIVNPAGFTIHSAVHEVRKDAVCVMHLHTVDGTAVSTLREGLLPLNQTSQLVTGDLAYHDYEGLALESEQRPMLQQDLGNHSAMLLRNHGTLTVGKTVAEAFVRMYFLERACTMQVRTLSQCGRELYQTAVSVIEKNKRHALAGFNPVAQHLVWPALIRKLDRMSACYKT